MGGRGSSGGGGGGGSPKLQPLTGSEKQIAWANDIRGNVLDTFAYMRNNVPKNLTAEQKKQTIDNIKKLESAMREGVRAGDIIDAFGDVRFGSNKEQNAVNLMSVFRVTRPNSDWQRKLFGILRR